MSFSQVFMNTTVSISCGHPLHHTQPAWILRRIDIELMKCWISGCVSLSHSSTIAWVIRWTVVGCGSRLLTRWFRISQMCSIGLRSGEKAGQSNVWSLFWSRYSRHTRATCGLALSCWKTKETATGAKASSRYRTTFKLPSINTNDSWVLCLKLMPTKP